MKEYTEIIDEIIDKTMKTIKRDVKNMIKEINKIIKSQNKKEKIDYLSKGKEKNGRRNERWK